MADFKNWRGSSDHPSHASSCFSDEEYEGQRALMICPEVTKPGDGIKQWKEIWNELAEFGKEWELKKKC